MQDTLVLEKPVKSDSDYHILTAVKGGTVTFASRFFMMVSGFLFSLIMARFLGAGQYGLYKLCFTITAIVGALCFFGLDGGLVRYLPLARNEQNKRKITGLIQLGTGIPGFMSLILSIVCLLMIEPLASNLLGKPEIIPVLRIAILTIPIGVMNLSLQAISQGFKQVQYIAYSQIAFNFVKLALSFAVLLFGFGVLEVATMHVLASALGLTMMLYFANKLFPVKQIFTTAERRTREIMNFSLPLYMQRLLNQFGRKVELLVLGYFGMMADVGVFSAILTLSAIGNMAFTALRKISAPIIAELHSQNKIDELRKFYQTTTKWAFSFNLPIFLTIVLFAKPLLSIFGKEFSVGMTGLIILAAGTLYNVSTGSCGTVINMSGHSKLGLLNSIIYLSTTLVLDFILIPKWLLLGAALAATSSIFVNNTLRLVEVYILINRLLPFNWTFIKPILATLVAGGLTYALRNVFLVDSPLLQVLVLVPLMWIIYILTILVQKLSSEDRMILNKVLKKLKKNKK